MKTKKTKSTVKKTVKKKAAPKKKAVSKKKAAPKKKTTTKKKSTAKKAPAKKKAASTKKKSTAKKASSNKKAVSTPDKKPAKKRNYLNNKDLLAAVIESKKRGKMTDKLALMLQTLCARYARKGSFASYTYNDDMQAYAMLMLVRTWNSFKPEKSNNPFAFFTQCIKHSFIQYLKQEKRQRDIRDSVLVNNGLSPSFNFLMEHEKEQQERRQMSDDKQYFDESTDESLSDESQEQLVKY